MYYICETFVLQAFTHVLHCMNYMCNTPKHMSYMCVTCVIHMWHIWQCSSMSTCWATTCGNLHYEATGCDSEATGCDSEATHVDVGAILGLIDFNDLHRT